MRYELVLFDLDGTLLDTLRDLTEAVNHALSAAGFPLRSEEQVRLSIGNGIARLIRKSVPEGVDDDTRSAILADFRRFYTDNVDVYTRPFPGIPQLLRQLRAEGVKIAVNSNKVDDAVRRLCEAHFPGMTDRVLGELPDIPKKPSPEGARRILAELGVAQEKALYVGDGDTDILTAQSAGIDAAWVSWGYRKREELGGLRPDYCCGTPEDLLRVLCN